MATLCQKKLQKKIKSKNFPRKVFPYLWRGDFQCGVNAKNPLGTQAECDPYSDKPCCSEFGWCGNTNNHCNCEKCKRSEKLENRKEYKNKEQTHTSVCDTSAGSLFLINPDS